MDLPTVSVIIPIKMPNEYLWETLDYLERVDYSKLDVVVLPDQMDETCAWAGRLGVTFILTGPVGPGEKRDIGAERTNGEILAFLDDDAFPTHDWLSKAIVHFVDSRVAAVGGPAVTPPMDNMFQQASGLVYQSWLGGGNYAYRYISKKSREIDDYPTCNLLVRRSAFEAAGGFDTHFWPGEDTKLCLTLVRDLGLRIVYEPEAIVYHHRRALFKGHLAQMRNYALHRGYFSKRFPETSLRPSYFLPTLLMVGLVGGGVGTLLWVPLGKWYGLGVGFYLGMVFISAVAATSMAPTNSGVKKLLLAPLVTAGIVATHIVYGICFVVGMLLPKLREE